jgi:hypothetical protein
LKNTDSKILTSKKASGTKLKEISKIEGKHINVTEGIDFFTLTMALKVKAQIEQLESTLKELETQLKPLRDELASQASELKESEYDSVEFVNDGKRLYMYPKNTKSGKYDESKLVELAKQKKIYSKIFKKTVKVDEDELIKALQQGKITPDEFRQISLQVLTDVVEIKTVVNSILDITDVEVG